MSGESILLTHAEVAAVVAGFASVVAALRQPLSPLQRQRFLMILLTALASVLSALVPVWLSESGVAGPTLWRAASAILLTLTLAVTVINLLPMRTLGARVAVIVNQPVTYLLQVNFVVYLGLLVFNLFRPAPSFSYYYASLLCGLANSFIVFADVVLQRDDSTH